MFVNALEWTISSDTLTFQESYHVGEKYEVVYSLKSNLPIPAPVKFITTDSDKAFTIKGCTETLAPRGGGLPTCRYF